MLRTSPPPNRLAATHEVVLRDGSTLHVRPLEPPTRTRCTSSSAPCRPTQGRSGSCRWGSTCVQRPGTRPRWMGATGWGSSRWVPTAGSSRTRCTSGSTLRAPRSRSPSPTRGRATDSARCCWGSSPRSPPRGIPQFVALVRADNRRMVDVFRQSGFPASVRARSGVVEVELPTALGAEALASVRGPRPGAATRRSPGSSCRARSR